jgi:hypothetical protein
MNQKGIAPAVIAVVLVVVVVVTGVGAYVAVNGRGGTGENNAGVVGGGAEENNAGVVGSATSMDFKVETPCARLWL